MSYKNKDKNISDYNTFEVFEDIYKNQKSEYFNELQRPQDDSRPKVFRLWLSFIFFIVAVGVSIHPILSYYLKTPYPLIVIAEDSMQPSFNPNDLVLAKGIVSQEEIKVGDIIIFHSDLNSSIIIVKRVDEIKENKLIVKGDSPYTQIASIYPSQVIGKIVGNGQFRLPLIGSLSTLIARK